VIHASNESQVYPAYNHSFPAPLQGRTTGKSTYGSNFNNNSSNEVLSNSRSIKMTLVNKA